MSDGVNEVRLVGNVGGDAEIAYTGGGQPYMKFSLCTNKSWKDRESGERKSKATWHNIIMWGKRAEGLHQHIRKGDIISVHGEIDISTYEDREGVKRKSIQIVIDDLTFIWSKKRDDDQEPQESRGPSRRQQRDQQRQQQRDQQRPASDDPPDGWGDESPPGDDDFPF